MVRMRNRSSSRDSFSQHENNSSSSTSHETSRTSPGLEDHEVQADIQPVATPSLRQFDAEPSTRSRKEPEFRAFDVVEAPSREPPRPLGWWAVASLIINKMIGTGIFTAPPTVLALTGQKSEAFGLWVAGFIYTLISTIVYLEYARRLPHTGGELIYLDETFDRPPLLTYTIYATYFMLISSSSTNCMQFANQVLLAANSPEPDQRLLRFIAVVVLSVICLGHYFSAATGRRLSNVIAVLKVFMLLGLSIGGLVRIGQHTNGDFSTRHAPASASSTAAAFLLILFSFQGWENATFVSGEIRNYSTLRKGFIVGVTIVGILYLLVTLVFLFALPYAQDAFQSPDAFQFAPKFFGNGEGAKKGWAVLIAISAFGNLTSVIYTASRVKQCIGKTNIFPWSRFLCASSPFTPSTPQGGLIAHWITSVAWIGTTAAISNIVEAISLSGNTQSYAEAIFGVAIGLGFPFLARRIIPRPTNRSWTNQLESRWLQSNFAKWIVAVIYTLFNLAAIISIFIGPYRSADGRTRSVKGWYYITICCAAFSVGGFYYFGLYRLKNNGGFRSKVIERYGPGTPILKLDPEHDPEFGFRKSIVINLRADPKISQRVAYFLSGGSDQSYHPPLQLRIRDFLATEDIPTRLPNQHQDQ